MTRERARELLGGLASGILTPGERQTLFEAALHDQTLFNEVADELEFAAFLQSSETRAQLANRIEVEPEHRRWWALRPAWLALSGVVAASVVLFVAIRHRPAEVAELSVSAPRVTESSSKQPAPAISRQEPNSVPTKEMMPTSARPPMHKPAGSEEAKDSVAENRPQPPQPSEARVKKVPEPAAPAARAIMAAPMATQLPAPSAEARLKKAPEPAAPAARAIMTAPMATQPPPPSPEARVKKVPEPAAPTSARAIIPAPMAAPMATQPPPRPVQAQQSVMAGASVETAPAASLTGTVHDVSGAAVPGAKVDVVNNSTNTTTHMVADSNGRFVALSLPQGSYTVTANVPGFIAEHRSITLQGDQPAQIDIPLQTGAMAEMYRPSAGLTFLPTSQNLTQIAVLDFANGSRQNPSGAQVADQLSSQLLSGGQLGVIARDKVQQAAQSQNATGHPPNAEEAAALGRSIGADAVIVGSVQTPAAVAGSGGAFANRKAAGNVSVMAEIIDTKQVRPMVKVSADAASLKNATNILGDKIQSQLARPVEGKVTHRTGDIVSVTFTELSGLRIGARCDVIRDARKIGELLITSVNGLSAFGKFSGAIQPRAGDRVTSSR